MRGSRNQGLKLRIGKVQGNGGGGRGKGERGRGEESLTWP